MAASCHWLRPFSDRDRGMSVGKWRLRWTSYQEPSSPTFIYNAVWRGPTNHVGLDAPDQGVRTRLKRSLGLMVGNQNLTFSPLISRHFLRSLISYSKLSIHIFFFLFLSYSITD
jgi:hypothetical protein